MIDLDAAEERSHAALAGIGRLPATAAALDADASLRDVPGLVAELRAARERIAELEAENTSLAAGIRELGQALDEELGQ